MTKKGAMPIDTVVMFALLGLTAFVLIYWIFWPTASEAGMIFSSQTLYAKDKQCMLEGQRIKELADRDRDKRPDRCDICPDVDNKDDMDGDGLPDGCDKEPDDRTSVVCRVKTTKDGRCVIS